MTQDELEKDLEKVFEVPSVLVEDGIKVAKEGKKILVSKTPLKRAEEYWETLGPGLTTGAADDDPTGIATFSQAGAQYGFQLSWIPIFTYPFMSIVQEMCARIGIVSGQGLAANIRKHYSASVLYTIAALLFFANTINIAADLGAMAAASRLVFPSANVILLIVFFAAVSLGFQLFTTYARYAKYLKYMTFSLLSYIVVAFVVQLDWREVFAHALSPSITWSKNQIFLLCAMLGTTISPYLFFWQTSQEVEEGILRGERSIAERQAQANHGTIKKMRIDVWSGMAFSNLISFFIFVACAGTLFAHGITDIATADEAALALRPFGEFAYWLFAFGIIGTGMLAIPVFAGSTAYALAESFGWKYGMYRKMKRARAFYGVIIASVGIGIIANFIHIDPMRALIYASVANGIIAPFILFFVVRIAGNEEVMGKHASHPLLTLMGWLTIIGMAFTGVAAIVTFFL